MEKTYTLILADGTRIENLSKNGTNYVSDVPVSEDIFRNNCSPMTVSDGTTATSHPHAELVQITTMNEQYYLAFRDIPFEEIFREEVRSDIDYIAMMSDIDLEGE